MRRRRKNQKREKMIMLCSSVLVLTALTMTGLYVKEKKQVEEDGYVVDLSKLEPQTTQIASEEEEDTDSAQVSSPGVKNQDSLRNTGKNYESSKNYNFLEKIEEEYAENDLTDFLVQEEELEFSEKESLLWPIVGNVLINYDMEKPVYFATLDQ